MKINVIHKQDVDDTKGLSATIGGKLGVKLSTNTSLEFDTSGGLGVATASGSKSGVVKITPRNSFPSSSDTDPATPEYVRVAILDAIATGGTGTTVIEPGDNVLIEGDGTAEDPYILGVPVSTDTVKGVISLNIGSGPDDSTNASDALTATGVASLLNDTTLVGGNPLQKAVVNAVESAIGSDTLAQTAIATTLIDNATLGVVSGKIAVNPGQLVSSDAANSIGVGSDGKLKVSIPAQLPDDQVLSGDNSGTVSVILTPVVMGDQTNYTIKSDLKVAATTPTDTDNLLKFGAAGFYVSSGDVVTPVSTDTVQGKVALNLGNTLPGDFTNAVDALTSSGASTMLNDTSVAGGNPLQKAVVNAVEAALGSDTGAQIAISNAIKEEVATALTSDPTALGTLADGLRDATDTKKGVVTLAVAANHPSTSDIEAATPSYVNLAIGASSIATKVGGGTNVTITGLGTTSSPLILNSTADVKDTLSTGNKIATVDSVVLNETVTTLLPKATGKGYTFTKENNTQANIDPANMKSDDAGQSLSIGSDGGLFVNVIALLPEESEFSGSTSGDVEITLTPDINNPNLFTIEGNLKVAATTPTNTVNLLNLGASGYYVSGEEISDTINESPAATETMMNAVVDALISDPAKLQALANALSGLLPDAFDA